jgi:hypothetical protein
MSSALSLDLAKKVPGAIAVLLMTGFPQRLNAEDVAFLLNAARTALG